MKRFSNITYNLEYNLHTEFVIDMFEERDLSKSQGEVSLQNLARKPDYQSTVVTLEMI